MRVGKSKRGSDYAVVRVLTPEPEMYELFFGASELDLVRDLQRGHVYDFEFDLVPGFSGGVRLRLLGVPVDCGVYGSGAK